MIFPPTEFKSEGAPAADRLLAEPGRRLWLSPLAGPSALATVMLLVSQAPERKLEWVAALTVTMLVVPWQFWFWLNAFSAYLVKPVVVAVERLMGLILVAVSD